MTQTADMPIEPPPGVQVEDEHFQAALEEEQRLLDQAVQVAQAQHLMKRVVSLNADRRREDAQKGGDVHPIFE